MIEVAFDGRYGIILKGHAGQAPYGRDIVCAGASALLCSLAKFFVAHTEELAEYEIDVNGGFGKVRVLPKDYFEQSCLAVFELARGGFSELAEHYPSYIRQVPIVNI
ncbi:MAG: ribosomal-processing cysteine protease Prp [Clostridia bacterium]|nr:ribosomal-processing cysteine protease Prp [Clostridia bacterium]